MDVTRNCVISGKYGFDLTNSNRFAILEVEAKNGDLIKVNNIDGVRYSELWDVVEQPLHDEKPIINDANKVIIVGGEEERTKRVLCVVGK